MAHKYVHHIEQSKESYVWRMIDDGDDRNVPNFEMVLFLFKIVVELN